jgi:hypothetical protein
MFLAVLQQLVFSVEKHRQLFHDEFFLLTMCYYGIGVKMGKEESEREVLKCVGCTRRTSVVTEKKLKHTQSKTKVSYVYFILPLHDSTHKGSPKKKLRNLNSSKP